MAQRRMFNIKIIDSSKFIKMPSSTRLLYYDLNMRADDDGVVEAFNVLRLTGATEDDLRVLVSKGFVEILNDDLVTYINDWSDHNQIRPDRKIDSIYKDLILKVKPDVKLIESRERADSKKSKNSSIEVKRTEDGQTVDVQWTEDGQTLDENGQHRLVKVSLGKDKLGKNSTDKDKAPKNDINALVDTYTNNDELKRCIKDFIQMRKDNKSKLSERALKMLLNKLDDLAQDDTTKVKILEQSIFNTWKSVFPLKNYSNDKAGEVNGNGKRNNESNSDPFDI